MSHSKEHRRPAWLVCEILGALRICFHSRPRALPRCCSGRQAVLRASQPVSRTIHPRLGTSCIFGEALCTEYWQVGSLVHITSDCPPCSVARAVVHLNYRFNPRNPSRSQLWGAVHYVRPEIFECNLLNARVQKMRLIGFLFGVVSLGNIPLDFSAYWRIMKGLIELSRSWKKCF